MNETVALNRIKQKLLEQKNNPHLAIPSLASITNFAIKSQTTFVSPVLMSGNEGGGNEGGRSVDLFSSYGSDTDTSGDIYVESDNTNLNELNEVEDRTPYEEFMDDLFGPDPVIDMEETVEVEVDTSIEETTEGETDSTTETNSETVESGDKVESETGSSSETTNETEQESDQTNQAQEAISETQGATDSPEVLAHKETLAKDAADAKVRQEAADIKFQEQLDAIQTDRENWAKEEFEKDLQDIKANWEKFSIDGKSEAEVQEFLKTMDARHEKSKIEFVKNTGKTLDEINDRNFGFVATNINGVEVNFNSGTTNFSDLISSPWFGQRAEAFSFKDKLTQDLLDAKPSGNNPRNSDTEFVALNQILQNLDTVNADWDSTTGGVIIYTERESCESCQDAKDQFNKYYPNVDVTLIDKYGRKW